MSSWKVRKACARFFKASIQIVLFLKVHRKFNLPLFCGPAFIKKAKILWSNTVK